MEAIRKTYHEAKSKQTSVERTCVDTLASPNIAASPVSSDDEQDEHFNEDEQSQFSDSINAKQDDQVCLNDSKSMNDLEHSKRQMKESERNGNQKDASNEGEEDEEGPDQVSSKL